LVGVAVVAAVVAEAAAISRLSSTEAEAAEAAAISRLSSTEAEAAEAAAISRLSSTEAEAAVAPAISRAGVAALSRDSSSAAAAACPSGAPLVRLGRMGAPYRDGKEAWFYSSYLQ
jgi:hypothetical protein